MSTRLISILAILLTLQTAACTEPLSSEQQFQAQIEETDACLARMRELAEGNENYVPTKDYSVEERDALIEFHNSQPEQWKHCAIEIARRHQDAVFEACQFLKCGKNIGGGCYHIADYSLHPGTIEAAIERCAHN